MKSSFFAAVVLAITANYLSTAEECIKGPSHLYSGSQSTTESGFTCQRWDADEPHEVKHVPKDGGHHNFCRNPDRDSRGTWCYTTDTSMRWEYCGIPQCDDAAVIVWASYNDKDNSSSFEDVKGDPEFVSQNGLGLSDLPEKVFKNAQIRAVGASKDGKEIFFTDVKNDYFGVFNKETSEVERYLEGEASGIYAIAQDYVTGNFYYTDTVRKCVMVADRKFRAKLRVRKTAPSEPRAIAILHGERRIVFSTYVKLNTKIRGSKIVMTDMAGQNEKVLLKSPEVVDVTGLAADEERIYFTDNLGYASKVMSIFFDGSDKVEHYFKKSASYQDIAVYSEYMYVTDAQVRYNYFDHIRYHVDVISKDTESNQIYTYTRKNLPHGIAVLDETEDNDLQAEIGLPLKRCMSRCPGICLPRGVSGVRCACSFGFRPRPNIGKCVPFRARLVEEGRPKKKSG